MRACDWNGDRHYRAQARRGTIARRNAGVQELLAKLSHALVGAQLDTERVVQIATDAATELSGAAFGAFFYDVQEENGEWYTLYTLSGAPREAFARFPQPAQYRGVRADNSAVRGWCAAATSPLDPRYGRND